MRWQVPKGLSGRYSLTEVLPPLGLLGWTQLDIWTGDVVTGSRSLVALSVCVAAVALVARRRRPITALFVTACAIQVPAALGTAATSAPAVLLLVLAVFSAGRYAATRPAVSGLLLAVVTALVGSAAIPEETLASSWAWSLNMVWIWGLGRWLHETDARVRATQRQAETLARAAAAEERLRVARDLHDVLAHSLSMMVVQAEVADELMDRDPGGARRAVRNVQRAGREALNQTRGVLGLLRGVDVEPAAGLADLPGLVEMFRTAGLPVVFEADPGLCLTASADEGVFRLVEESLTNTLRHAGPQPTSIRLRREEGGMTVQVENDGPQTMTDPEMPPGHGLLGMRERIEACGGHVETGPRPQGGFHVKGVLPRSAMAG